MSNFAKNMYAFLFVLLAIAAVFGGIGWYIDQQFGGGVSILAGFLLIGVVITLAISSITMMMNNRTHQSAGDDITAYAEAMAKVDATRHRVQIEFARERRELSVIGAKGQLSDKQSENRLNEWEYKRERQRLEAEAAQVDAEAEDAQWYQVGDDADFVDRELT